MISLISKKNISISTLKYHTFDSEMSLLKQSNCDKNRLQKDGWGLGYYKLSKPITYKSPNPVYKETNELKNQIEKVNSKIFIFHIRYASNPRKLDNKKLIGFENTQPFYYSEFIFSHNGTLSIVDEIFLNLGKYSSYVKGVNDSEVLFWNFIKHIDAYGDVSTALEMMRDEINTVWISAKKKYQINKPYNGINIFVSDSKTLFALCDFKMEKEKYAIMSKRWEYGRFAYRKDGDVFVISSEPTDIGKWHKLIEPSVLLVDSNLNIKINKLED